MNTFLIVILGTLNFAANAVETQPYKYQPSKGLCLNGQGLSGMRQGFKGSCGDLWGEELKGQNLAGSDLSGANLSRADLSNADLRKANLIGAKMLLTNVKGARLEGAVYNERTVLPFPAKEAEKRGMVFVPSRK
ncbi:MAG: pentapeptide repeat-containing protein [Bdellovibrionales bacterium]|nr:pentapeptide repeat-containing protein [Bdellovibrionales bacterium]